MFFRSFFKRLEGFLLLHLSRETLVVNAAKVIRIFRYVFLRGVACRLGGFLIHIYDLIAGLEALQLKTQQDHLCADPRF